VWRLEPKPWINPAWRESIVAEKPNAMVSDNNLSSCPEQHVADLVDHLVEHGKGVVFDNGLDCKLITPEVAGMLSRLKFVRHGMRLAFDRIEEDGVFQEACRRLAEAGVPPSQTMAYVLFNFHDTPQEADYRMQECRRLGVRPYPQRFQRLDQRTRRASFVGEAWTRRLANRFRYFWLMAGLNTRMSFDDYVHKVESRLGPDDVAAWEAGAEEWRTRKWKK